MNSSYDSKKYSVAIIGANGYVGLELARLLLKHPSAHLRGCYARNLEWQLADHLSDPNSDFVPTLGIDQLKKHASDLTTVFLATPPEVSMELVPMLLEVKTQVIDLSGAFRLNSETFEKWYHLPHSAQSELKQATYGLVPWANAAEKNQLISNPGCFATSILMALIPLLKSHLVQPDSIVIDSKSGTSGAGLKAKESLLFNEVDGDCSPYRVGYHQHLPEIIQYLQKFAGVEINPHFSTSLLPTRRGIISAIYASLPDHLSDLSETRLNDLFSEAFDEAYQAYPLVKHGKLGQSESKDKMFLSLKKVSGSCRTHISYRIVGKKVYVFSVLDNLLKGAASQAIENWNVTNGFNIETGLTASEGLL